MTAIPESDAAEPFGRYRFRGLDPKAVERWAINYENENAALRSQIAALEARAAKADAFAEEAAREMIALHEIVNQAETDQATLDARQRLSREDAAKVVHDAWIEANAVRAETQRLVEQTQAELESAKQEHTQQREAMRAEMMEETNETVRETRRAIAVESEEQRARIASELAAHQTQLATERTQHDARIATESDEHQTRLTTERTEHESRIAAESDDHQARITTERTEHDARIATESEEHETRITIERSEHESRIATESDEHQARLTAEFGEHRALLTAEIAAHQTCIAALEAQRARLVAEIEAATARVLSAIEPLKSVTPPAAPLFDIDAYARHRSDSWDLEENTDDAAEQQAQTRFVIPLYRPDMAAPDGEETTPNGRYDAELEDAEVIC